MKTGITILFLAASLTAQPQVSGGGEARARNTALDDAGTVQRAAGIGFHGQTAPSELHTADGQAAGDGVDASTFRELTLPPQVGIVPRSFRSANPALQQHGFASRVTLIEYKQTRSDDLARGRRPFAKHGNPAPPVPEQAVSVGEKQFMSVSRRMVPGEIPGRGPDSPSMKQQPRNGLQFYRASQVALAASTAADVGLSVRLMRRSPYAYERNPVLAGHDGRIGHRGIAIAGAITAGALLAGHLVLRKHPELRRSMAWVNFAVSAVHAGAAGWAVTR